VLANVAFVFISLLLLVRVLAVEPFGVPTGSMAPALIGNHRQAPCPRCGHPVRVGAPNGVDPVEHYDRDRIACPNCLQHLSLTDARDLSGDRLLVDKNVFSVRRPRRWEMLVFHCPDTDPKEYRKPYVKRVVGLPGECVLIIDGDIYLVSPHDDSIRELIRKTLPEQRETRVTVFDMNYLPKPGGWNPRWLAEPGENDPRFPAASGQLAEPAGPEVVTGSVIRLDAAPPPRTSATLTYRHWNLDTRREDVIRAWNSYDGVPRKFGTPAFDSLDEAHDFSFDCEVEVVAARSGEGRFFCRLDDGADRVLAEIPVGKPSKSLAVIAREDFGPLESARDVRLEPGSTHRIEFSFVDRRAILAIDGRVVIPHADLPAPTAKRNGVARPLRLEARDCQLVVRNLKLYRDVHYTQFGEHGTHGDTGWPRPAILGPGEYFVLGDNSGNSQDSRKWPYPAVPEAEIIGKPFLIHQPLRPAKMTIGGRERHYQTVDWSRLRWLH
jgi:signal peptidase I